MVVVVLLYKQASDFKLNKCPFKQWEPLCLNKNKEEKGIEMYSCTEVYKISDSDSKTNVNFQVLLIIATPCLFH